MMMTRAGSVVRLLVISLVMAAISRGEAVRAATLPVVTVQGAIEQAIRTPTRLALGAGGSLYVADPANQGVLKFDAAGKLTRKIAVKGIPQGVAVMADGRLLVSQKEFVAMYDANGTELRRLGAGDGQFVSASHVALDDAGRIYVTDSKGHSVQVFDANGGYLSRFGAQGSGPGQFLYPTAIAYEKLSQQIAVVDSLNARVQFYDKNGAFVHAVGGNGTGPLLFMHPQGLAFEYGADATVRMYVSDAIQKNIQAIEPAGSGTFLSYVAAGRGTEHGLPTALAFDQAAKRLYVVDGLGSITVCLVSDGSIVTNSVTAAPANATVITSAAPSGSLAAVTATPPSAVAPFILSMVADGSAVSSELLDVTGLVTTASSVTVNGVPVATINGLFSTAIPLQTGANAITVTATDRSGKSWSEVRTVTKSPVPSALTVNNPDVFATATATLALTGGVPEGIFVSVAGVPADVTAQKWSAQVVLAPGVNTVEVQAMDLNGQTSTQKRTVFYNPAAPALAITSPAEDTMSATRSITIKGTVAVTPDINVTAEVNGSPVPVTITGGDYSLPVTFSTEGIYTVTVTAALADGNTSTVSRSVVYRKKP